MLGHFTAHQKQRMITLSKQDLTPSQIATRLGCSCQSINRVLVSCGCAPAKPKSLKLLCCDAGLETRSITRGTRQQRAWVSATWQGLVVL